MEIERDVGLGVNRILKLSNIIRTNMNLGSIIRPYRLAQ